ncbi:MAG: NADH-ubiquinone oxidoreductase-F iron-sulfur binding region domain-containing protein, partial [Candidatus Aminicenantales bacterium]
NPLLKRTLEKVMEGRGTARDLADLEAWGKIIKSMSRCGLGQTSPNPILTTLQNFREMYQSRIGPEGPLRADFDLAAAAAEAASVTGQRFAGPGEEAPHE